MNDGGALKNTIDNLELITSKLKKSLNKLPHTMDNINAVSDSLQQAEIKSLINSTAEALIKLNDILTKTSNGEGTFGKLVACKVGSRSSGMHARMD